MYMNVYVCELCGGGGVWGSVECEVAGELGSWLFPFSIITELGVCEATYVCTMHTYIGSCYTCLPPYPPTQHASFLGSGVVDSSLPHLREEPAIAVLPQPRCHSRAAPHAHTHTRTMLYLRLGYTVCTTVLQMYVRIYIRSCMAACSTSLSYNSL